MPGLSPRLPLQWPERLVLSLCPQVREKKLRGREKVGFPWPAAGLVAIGGPGASPTSGLASEVAPRARAPPSLQARPPQGRLAVQQAGRREKSPGWHIGPVLGGSSGPDGHRASGPGWGCRCGGHRHGAGTQGWNVRAWVPKSVCCLNPEQLGGQNVNALLQDIGHGLQGLQPRLLVPEVQGARRVKALSLLGVQVDAQPRARGAGGRVLELWGAQGGTGRHQQGTASPAFLGAPRLQRLSVL